MKHGRGIRNLRNDLLTTVCKSKDSDDRMEFESKKPSAPYNFKLVKPWNLLVVNQRR